MFWRLVRQPKDEVEEPKHWSQEPEDPVGGRQGSPTDAVSTYGTQPALLTLVEVTLVDGVGPSLRVREKVGPDTTPIRRGVGGRPTQTTPPSAVDEERGRTGSVPGTPERSVSLPWCVPGKNRRGDRPTSSGTRQTKHLQSQKTKYRVTVVPEFIETVEVKVSEPFFFRLLSPLWRKIKRTVVRGLEVVDLGQR